MSYAVSDLNLLMRKAGQDASFAERKSGQAEIQPIYGVTTNNVNSVSLPGQPSSKSSSVASSLMLSRSILPDFNSRFSGESR